MPTKVHANKGIVCRRLASQCPSRTVTAIWLKHRYYKHAATRFLDVLRD
jgi:hypothetical protein